MLILKLGGAAITDKTTANSARQDFLAHLATLIARYPQPLILIHGAGSYGHIIAKEHELHLGYKNDAQRQALVQLQIQLHELNRMVIEALNTAGVLAMPVHPASMCILQERRIVDFFIEPVKNILEMKLIPVLYGDCVWDRKQVFGIISGDQLAVYLANALQADKLAFGTNVEGVLDAQGQVIPRLKASVQVQEQHQGAERADVTGGMLGKLSEIAALQHPATRTWIFNLQNLDHLERILSGQGEAGTLVEI